ncbi:hypothetical protein LTS07_003803 [Exophiala sideris]|uniref:7-alpha-hydroxysteroid dehydrogenase n=1 Tax=Exophiala sideris TaxID=1016849 RepID=A0ABR0JH56_9EURO|nr:hypothetical protein LTS07_003803 [Exophiala sideris]KAK5064043.1 hypothetical protein LTR69_003811 [Exophiala sideris]
MSSQKAWAVVAGVGPGTGASVARRFAKQYSVALLARNPSNYEPLVKEIESAGGKAVGISTDCADGKSVKSAFEQLKKEMGGAPLAAAIYNVGGRFIRKPFLELNEEEFESGWEANGYVSLHLQAGCCLMKSSADKLFRRGGFHFSQAVLPLLLEALKGSPEHPPTLIFTSATAAMKGSALCSSFATGKFAMRALAQSLAREFGPKGVHVSHAIIDGVIDIERTKHYQFDHPDAKIKPEAIADSYWYLHTQPRTCFTNELDIRPYIEKW